MNRILFCHILLHGGSGHSTKCDLRGKRDPLQESTWGSAMRSKKKVLLRTRSGSGSCCCSLPGTVPACPAWWFRMQCLLWSHFTGGIWKTCEEKKKKKVFGKKKKLSTNWHIPQNVPYACLCFSLPQKAQFIYVKIKLTNSGVFFHVCSTHPSLALFPVFIHSL